jgi:hypothetical protein
VGQIAAADLADIGRRAGHDGLPYPFRHTRAEHRSVRPTTPQRPDEGEFAPFKTWADAYAAAEIWVTCRVHHRRGDIAVGRVLGFFAGDDGYLATQRSDEAIAVYTMRAGELAAAIAGSAGLSRPGRHRQVVVPGYVGYFTKATNSTAVDDDECGPVSVLDSPRRPSQPRPELLADSDVAAVTIIQSRYRPAREWGVDWAKPLIACVQIDGDGDYIYLSDYSEAIPATEAILAERVGRLIADDLVRRTAPRP